MNSDVCAQAAALISKGALPGDLRNRSFGGRCIEDDVCAVCGKPIVRSAPLIELDWKMSPADRHGPALHPECYQAWFQALRHPVREAGTKTADRCEPAGRWSPPKS
jgi:hypothetical protein